MIHPVVCNSFLFLFFFNHLFQLLRSHDCLPDHSFQFILLNKSRSHQLPSLFNKTQTKSKVYYKFTYYTANYRKYSLIVIVILLRYKYRRVIVSAVISYVIRFLLYILFLWLYIPSLFIQNKNTINSGLIQ